jgi:predicted ArsR family transcriptional regulator
VRDIAERLGISATQVKRALAALEAQLTVTREFIMRRIAETWLEGQRKVYPEM